MGRFILLLEIEGIAEFMLISVISFCLLELIAVTGDVFNGFKKWKGFLQRY